MVSLRGGWKHFNSLKAVKGARKLLKLLWPPPPLRKQSSLPGSGRGVGEGEGHSRDSLWGLRMHFQEERPQAPGQWTGRGHSVPALLRHNFPLGQTQTRLWRQMRPKVTPARGHPCQRSPQGQTTSPITWFSLKSMSLGLTLVRREGLGS